MSRARGIVLRWLIAFLVVFLITELCHALLPSPYNSIVSFTAGLGIGTMIRKWTLRQI